MDKSRNRLTQIAGTAAVGLLIAAAASPAFARGGDLPMPCSAFARNAYGGWRVLSPVTLAIDGTLYSPMVGTTLAAGSMQNGIEMSDVLDRQCGNR